MLLTGCGKRCTPSKPCWFQGGQVAASQAGIGCLVKHIPDLMGGHQWIGSPEKASSSVRDRLGTMWAQVASFSAHNPPMPTTWPHSNDAFFFRLVMYCHAELVS